MGRAGEVEADPGPTGWMSGGDVVGTGSNLPAELVLFLLGCFVNQINLTARIKLNGNGLKDTKCKTRRGYFVGISSLVKVTATQERDDICLGRVLGCGHGELTGLLLLLTTLIAYVSEWRSE